MIPQIELFNLLEKESSRNKKIEILKTLDKGSQDFLKYALDPYIRFHLLLNEEAPGGISPGSRESWWVQLKDLLDRLCEQGSSTNEDLKNIIGLFYEAPSLEDAKWACRLVNKDLRCGVSSKIVGSVFPDLLRKFDLALAIPFEDNKKPLGPCYVEPKIDGVRMVVVDGVPYSRTGHQLYNVGHIIKALPGLDRVWDGEVVSLGSTFEETVGAVRSYSPTKDSSNLAYYVFDTLTPEEWKSQDCQTSLDERKKVLRERASESNTIKYLFGDRIDDPTPELLYSYRDRFITEGWEGAMYKLASAVYPFKRSNTILKLKAFETVDVKVIGYEMGTGKHKGKLGAFNVELDDGTKLNVGSGFTDEQRTDFLARIDSLIGTYVEIKYQNKTTKGSARFPVFVRLRPDK